MDGIAGDTASPEYAICVVCRLDGIIDANNATQCNGTAYPYYSIANLGKTEDTGLALCIRQTYDGVTISTGSANRVPRCAGGQNTDLRARETSSKELSLTENSCTVTMYRIANANNGVAIRSKAEDTGLALCIRQTYDGVTISTGSANRVPRCAGGQNTDLRARETSSKELSLTENSCTVTMYRIANANNGVAIRSKAEDTGLALCIRQTYDRVAEGACTENAVAGCAVGACYTGRSRIVGIAVEC